MALLKEAELSGFLRQRLSSAVGLLVYGGNETGIQTVVDRVVKAFGRDAAVKRLSASAVKEDPAIVDESFRAMSFLGGRELVIVTDADDATGKSVASLFKETSPGNFLLFVAGNLGKGSVLRRSIEESESFFAVPVYDTRPADVMLQVQSVLRAEKLALSDEAAHLFQSLCGHDLGMALREAEKLALYCLKQTEVSIADVEACCGDLGLTDLDAVIDAVLDGDFSKSDNVFTRLDEADQRSLLPLFSLHLQKLQNLKLEAERLGGVESALRSAKPPIFFQRKAAISRQVSRLDIELLVGLQVLLESAVEQSRMVAGLSQAIVGRGLFALCQKARSSRA
jgi:DNA polymerase III subunit delta